MFTMNYVNGVYPVSYECEHERFHNMNACTLHSHGWTVFQSYQTPIAMFDGGCGLVVNEYFNCSASTRKQFSRWLSENGLPSYHDIKRFMESAEDGDIEIIDGCFVTFKWFHKMVAYLSK